MMNTRNLLISGLALGLGATTLLASADPRPYRWNSPSDRYDQHERVDKRDRINSRVDRSTRQLSFTDKAKVIDVEPIVKMVRRTTPQRECWDEEVYHSGNRRDDGVSAGEGTIAGTIIGGVIGSQVGKGDGNKAATIAGAVIGAAVGHDMAKGGDGEYSEPYSSTETRCETRHDVSEHERITGYRVTYRYKGHEFTKRMASDPGKLVDVRVRVMPIE